uniref:Transcriptional activator protein n=1 Tax=Cucurbit leaf crumple virus TaxID=134681 RepID=A0A3G5BM09_9GEMI|nr:Transcriptional Activator Protein [Cucurbit leaf crumple virus]
MPSSSSSKAPSIKAQHRAAKTRAIRRRRIDLDCGCSIYLHLNCADYGFSHRGTHHAVSGREFRFYLGRTKSPLFQDIPRRGSTIHNNEDIPHPDQIQPQPQESTKSSQSIPELPNLDDIMSSFWDDLFKMV